MSTILRALRKLEEEKARRGAKESGLAWNLLAPPDRRPFRPGLGWMALLGMVLFVLAGVSWWQWPEAPVDTDGIGAGAAPVSVAPAPGDKVNEEWPTLPEGVAGAGQLAPQAPTPAKKTAPRPAVILKPPVLVTGIAWQEEPDGRLAVVNGLPVMLGTFIEGWEVAAIEPRQVVFRSGEVSVAVPLTNEGQETQ